MPFGLHTFLKQRDIIFTLCAATIATQIVMFADLLTNSCVMPIINKDAANENTVEKFVVDLKGAKIELGKILVAIIRFTIVALLLYIIYYLLY